jgi:hypothetical protein
LIDGQWLGAFDQLTLLKGPSYPAFLALSHLSGLPVSLSHVIFQTISVTIATIAVFQLKKSTTIALMTLFFLSFMPIGFIPDLQRVVRDQIYWGQSIVVFALFAVIFLAPPRGRLTTMLISVLCGLMFGWAWLTREEGLWFLPGLGLMVVAAFLRNRGDWARIRSLLLNTGVIAIAFAIPHTAFMAGNKIAYGSFIGLDFKERNFISVLNVLQDVEVGPPIPYVPVSYAVRSEVAKVSPTFAPLNEDLAPGGPLAGWSDWGCALYEQTCGDFAGGWFMWALRDAAAINGFYESPENAARNFERIARDVNAACSDGRLRCHHRWVNYLPRMTRDQWSSVPRRFLRIGLLSMLNPKPTIFDETVSQGRLQSEEFKKILWFLNFPFVNRPAEVGRQIIVRGWYYDKNSTTWPDFKIYSSDGTAIEYQLDRRASRDLQIHFSDERAAENRFSISFYCPNECTIVVQNPEASAQLRLRISRSGSISATSDGATLYIDQVRNFEKASIASRVRDILVDIYAVLMPCLLIGGLLAAVAGVICASRARDFSAMLLVAVALWGAVATRIGILALIDASAFPATSLTYSAPASYLAVMAAILSLSALQPYFRLPEGLRDSRQNSSRVGDVPLS